MRRAYRRARFLLCAKFTAEVQSWVCQPTRGHTKSSQAADRTEAVVVTDTTFPLVTRPRNQLVAVPAESWANVAFSEPQSCGRQQ